MTNDIITKVCKATNEVWEFDTSNGCLHHPCGFLTSWFRRESEGNWTLLEAATTVLPKDILMWLSCVKYKTAKPFIAVLSVYRQSGVVEYEFNSGNDAQKFRETIPNWPIFTSITHDYDRWREREVACK